MLEHDNILRRTAFKDRMGLSIEYNIDELLAKSVNFNDMPEEARLLWAHKNKQKPTKTAKVDKLIPLVLITSSPAVSYVQDTKRGWYQAGLFELAAA